MRVALISRDDSLKRFRREVLAAVPGRHWNLRIASPDEPPPVADLPRFRWSSCLRVAMESQIREIVIAECCRRALHELRPLADAKSIALDLDPQAPGQPLCFDPSLTERLPVNLFENSCRFTPRGGYIHLRGFPAFWERRVAPASQDGVFERRVAWRRATACCLGVSDNGMGARPEHLQKIFQEHTSNGGGGDPSGGGLGLAICKRILAKHSGRSLAESRPKGATLVFYLPPGSLAAGAASAIDRAIHLAASRTGERHAT